MKLFAFCNNKFIKEDTPCISITDRGFLFGDGVFTTIKVENGKPLFFDCHVKRLYEQCALLGIIPPVIDLEDIHKLILKNKAKKGVWRLKIIITGGKSKDLTLAKRPYGKFLMMMSPVVVALKNALKLTIFPELVYLPTARFKTLSYLDRLFISDYASSQGVDDALVLSKDGFVTETAFSNIFWRLNDDIFIPDKTLELLMGITLLHWIDVLKKLHFKIHYVKEKIENIPAKAQVFICNAIKGVLPIVSIDKKKFDRDVKIEKEIFHNVQYAK